jgi:hypothetical protein
MGNGWKFNNRKTRFKWSGYSNSGTCFGGNPGASPYNTNATEEYNGSTWGPGGNLGTARYGMGAAGTQTAALGFAGVTYPTPVAQTATEEYDGSTWTAGGSINTGRRFLAGAGTQTAGLAAAGSTTDGSAILASTSEEYNGIILDQLWIQ